MDGEKERLLNEKRIAICSTVDVKNAFLFLRTYGKCDRTDEQNVSALPNEREQLGSLIDLVVRRGNDAFFIFCHSFKEKNRELFESIHNDVNINIEECKLCMSHEQACSICRDAMKLINQKMGSFKVNRAEDLSQACEKLIQKNKMQEVEIQSGKLHLESNIEQNIKRITEMTTEKVLLGTEKDILQNKVLSLQSKIKTLEEENSELKEKSNIVDNDEAMSFYQNQEYIYKSKYQKLYEEHEQIKIKYGIFEDKFRRLKDEKTTVEELLLQLRANCRLNYDLDENTEMQMAIKEKLEQDNEELVSDKSRLTVHNEGLSAKLKECENELDELKRMNEEKTQQLNILTPFKENYDKIKKISHFFKHCHLDRNAVIKQINNKYGITFNSRDAAVGESSIYLTDIDKRHLLDSTFDWKHGDFIMAINEYDVTEFSIEKAKELLNLLKKEENRIVLKIRRPMPEKKTFHVFDFERYQPMKHPSKIKSKKDSFGLKLKTVIEVEPNTYASDFTDFLTGDQLIKVGKESADDFSPEHLLKKITKAAISSTSEVTVKRTSRDRTYLDFRRDRSASDQYYSVSGPFSGQENSEYPPSRSMSRSVSLSSHMGGFSTERAPPALPLRTREITNSDAYDITSFQHREKITEVDTNNYEVIPRPLQRTLQRRLRKDSTGFGLVLVGGNKIGIFISDVDDKSDAGHTGVSIGWKILKIGRFSMKNAALCYAMKTLKQVPDNSVIDFEFEELPHERFQQLMEMKPHDYFSIKAMIDYNAVNIRELSFKQHEQLWVQSTYEVVDYDPAGPYRWRAFREGLNGSRNSGYIPNHLWSPQGNSGRQRPEHHYTMIPGDAFHDSSIYLIEDQSVNL